MNVIVMENTELTTGMDKDFPFRALVVGHMGFGHLPGFSSPSYLPPSHPLPGNFRLVVEWLSGPSGIRVWGSQAPYDALEQGSEVGELGLPCAVS